MCGICGIVGASSEEATQRVTAMCRSLAHRGPDDEHVISGSNWALGQRRLSIIDLSLKGRQPFVNEDGSCFLTSNGEIYNYRDLRSSLMKAGHQFISGSDCEVIIHLFEQEGVRGITKLNGMFAFAFIDTKRCKLWLCRDRVGIKPLYYLRTLKTLSFASEIKALIGPSAVLNRASLPEYIQYRYVSGSDTLFSSIQEVLPGHVVSVDLDTSEVDDREYWAPRQRCATGVLVSDRDLDREIEQAVARQLISDVPVGCQLSGGLDSSLVTQIAVRKLNHPIHTFSVGLDRFANDETSWAALVSRELGTIHHVIQHRECDFLEDLAVCTWLNDEPLNHPNSVAIFKMSRYAKSYVTVMMTGEGADELFGGYHWHNRLRRLSRIGWLAQSPLSRQVAGLLPRKRWEPILPLLGISPRAMAVAAGQLISDADLAVLLDQKMEIANEGVHRRHFPINEADALVASLDLDLRTYLVSVLHRQDRMSMASGVEARVPYLDHELMDFALRIPVEQLFECGRGKSILRHMAAVRIPDVIINRPKLGFSIPMASWMRQGNSLGNLLEWLYDERAAGRQIWKVDRIRSLAEDHRSGKADYSSTLWSFLSFEVWARIWLDGTPHEKLKDEILEVARVQGSGRGNQKSEMRKRSMSAEALAKEKAPVVTGVPLVGVQIEKDAADTATTTEERPRQSAVDDKPHVAANPPNVRGALRGTPEPCRRGATSSDEHIESLGVAARSSSASSADSPKVGSGQVAPPTLIPSTTQLINNSSLPPPLRVCHIVTSLRIGGMERMVCDLMGGLKEHSIESVLCCTDGKGELYDSAPAIAKICGHRDPGFFVVDFKLLLQIHRFVRDNNVSIIHAHNHAPHLYGAILSFFTGVPLIVTRHGQGYHDKRRVRFLKRFLAGKTGAVVLVSEDAKRISLKNRSLSIDDSMAVIPNGINTQLFTPRKSAISDHGLGLSQQATDNLRVRLGIPEDAVVIGSVGRLSPEKNYTLLVRAFAKLIHRCPLSANIENNVGNTPPLQSTNDRELTTTTYPYLLLVGDGLDRVNIEIEIIRSNVRDRCYISGIQSEVLPWLHMMDIFCLSSDTEGLSISLLEAGSCSLPCIATDVGGNGEVIVNEETGILVNKGDEKGLTVALDRLVHDETLRRRMGDAARLRIVELFSLTEMVKEYNRIYKMALKKI